MQENRRHPFYRHLEPVKSTNFPIFRKKSDTMRTKIAVSHHLIHLGET